VSDGFETAVATYRAACLTSYLELGRFEVENVGSQFLSLHQRLRLEPSPPISAWHRTIGMAANVCPRIK
jgi:hypothetical protein